MDDAVSEPEVLDVPEKHRYEIRVDGEVLGFAAYMRDQDVVVFTHTEIDPDHGGQGLGGRLVQWALDDVRAKGLSARPLCSFVDHWITEHPDYEDLRVSPGA